MPFKLNAAGRHHIGKMKFKLTNWAEYETGLRRPYETHPIFHFAIAHNWFKIVKYFIGLSLLSGVSAKQKDGSNRGGIQEQGGLEDCS
jgi:hypothetical protein